ncbi:MAG: hypothetical protein JWO06_2701, partial [Bacteroidota bacterium]|nr:hypothetical protein [Bacteroidota bacterium]
MIPRIFTKSIVLVCLLFFAGSSFAQFGPPNLSGLALWLRADSLVTVTGGSVTLWKDCSGNGIDATPVSGLTNPTLSIAPELNSKPTVKFNGIDNALGSVANIPGYNNSSLTVFILAKGYAQSTGFNANFLNVGSDPGAGLWIVRDITTGSFKVVSNYNAFPTFEEIPNSAPNAGFPYRIFGMQKDLGVDFKLDTNGVQGLLDNTSGQYGTFTNAAYRLGISPSQTDLFGDIAEIIVYTRALSPSERQQVLTYIRGKYAAPAVSLGPNINQINTVCQVVLRPNHSYLSYHWSTGATSDTIIATTNNTYSVTVTDAFGGTSSASVSVSLKNVNLNTTQAIDTICLGTTLPISTVIANPASFTYLWSNSLTTSSINAPSFSNGSSVTYSVIVTDSFGCHKTSNSVIVATDTFSKTVSLGPNQNLCSGNTIGLASPPFSTWSTLTFNWSTGSHNSTIPVTVTGNYLITVTDAHGCSATSTVHDSISGFAPVDSFTAVPSLCIGQVYSPVNNTDSLGQHITAFKWYFGNGDSSTLKNPTYTYPSAGTFVVQLKATNDQGCSNVVQRLLLANGTPVIAFNADTACFNNIYQFTDMTVYPTGNSLGQTTWLWNFGDTTATTNIQNPTHTYAHVGVHSVSVTITASDGCSASLTKQLHVVSTYPAPLPFTLLAPYNGIAMQPAPVTFKWTPSGNTHDYTITVSTDPTFSTGNIFYSGIAGTQYTATLATNNTYYWKVTAFNVCTQGLTSVIDSFSIFRPDNVSGLSLWLRGDSLISTAGRVSRWIDGSGNGVDALPVGGQTNPVLGTAPEFLNMPTVKYNGSSDLLGSAMPIPGYGSSSLTIFVLAKGYAQSGNLNAGFLAVGGSDGLWLSRNLTSGNYRLVNNFTNSQTTLDFPGTSASNAGFPYRIFGFEKNYGVSVAMDTNGTTGVVDHTNHGLSGGFTNFPYYVGSSQTILNGDIAEIIVYTTTLTPAQKRLVEDYLYTKYSPPVSLGPDIVQAYSLCPVVLNPGSRFLSYHWSTGATTSTIQPTTSGVYSVTTVDVFNHTTSSTVNVTLANLKLNADSAKFCTGGSVELKPLLSSFNNYTFKWSNNLTTDSIAATTAGNYFVTVKDTSGCSLNSDTIPVSVDNFGSTVSLGPDNSLCQGNSLSLLTPANGWGNLTFHWSQGNATTQTIPVTTTGQYSVTVTDQSGCSGTSTVHITVSGIAPNTSFTAPSSLCLGQPFAPQNTGDMNGVTFAWNFGDNTISTQTNPTHTYTTAGTYTVTLTATGTGGCANTATEQVVINAAPVAAFNASTACAGNSYQFVDMSTPANGDIINQWQWAFGDGGTAATQNPSNTYTAAGPYLVTLTVTGGNGCTASVSHSISVVSNFTLPSTPQLQTPVNNAALQSSAVTFKWGASSNTQNYTLYVSTDPTFASGNTIYNGLSTTQFSTSLSGNQTYYWKVSAFNICHDSSTSLSNSFSIFRPDNLAGLSLWLRADSGVTVTSGLVSRWHDWSNNNIDALTPTNGLTSPALSTAPEFLNMPTVKFNGSTDELASLASIPHLNDTSLTVFILAKGYSQSGILNAGFFGVGGSDGLWLSRNLTSNNYRLIHNFGASGAPFDLQGNSTPNAGFPYKIFGFEKDFGVSVALDTNGTTGAFDNANAGYSHGFSNAPYTIGYSQTLLNGEIPEVIIYTTKLTSTQKAQVENYLYNKYSPSVNLGPDIVENYSLCPKTLDPGSRFISYSWSTGATSQTIQVTQSGTYTVTAIDVFNRQSESSVHVILPNVALNIPDTTICLGNSVQLVSQVSSNYNFQWNNGPTTQSINVNTAGDYFVVIKDTTANHCSLNSDTTSVNIDNFSATVALHDTSLCSGNTYGLSSPASSTWGGLQFHWSSSVNTSTVIVGPGTQQYLVTVTNARGCAGTSSATVTITGVAPTLSFSGDTFCLGQTYNPQNTTNTGQNIISYNWDFGDGTTGTGYNPTHVYTAAGIKTVLLSVANSAGCTNTLAEQVNVKPTPSAAFNSGQACVSNSYQFADLSTPPAGSTINQWSWAFGDPLNTTANIPNPTFTYNAIGNYNASLTVSATNGCSNTATGVMQVVGSTTVPPPATLDIPLNNSVWDTTLVTFSWDVSAGASGYSLLVSTDPTFANNVSRFDNLTNTQLVTTLGANQQYYWRIIAYNICGQASVSQTFTFNVFNPSNIVGLALWLKGDSTSTTANKVNRWPDLSGNGVDAIQNTTANQPLVTNENLMNFKPVLKFNGTSSSLSSTQVIPNIDVSSASVFIITSGATQNSNASIPCFLNIGTLNTGMWFVRNTAAENFRMLHNYGSNLTFIDIPGPFGPSTPNSGYPFTMFEMLKKEQVADSGYINSTLSRVVNGGSTLNGPITNGIYNIGQTPGYSALNGEIAEIIVYNTSLNPTQRKLVENYIYNKYAPPVNLGPDIVRQYSLCPVVLDAQNRFVSFNWSTGDTTPTITVRKSGTYWVSTVDVFGRESSDTIHVTLPYRGITPDTSICLGQSVQLAQLISRPYQYTYLWQDGISTTNPLTVNTAGRY